MHPKAMPFFHVRVIRNNKMKIKFGRKVPLGVSFFLLQDFLRFLTIFFASSMVIFFCARKRKLRARVHARSNGSYLRIRTIDRSNSRSLCPRSPAERAPTWPPEKRRVPSFSLVLPTCFLPVVARSGTSSSSFQIARTGMKSADVSTPLDIILDGSNARPSCTLFYSRRPMASSRRKEETFAFRGCCARLDPWLPSWLIINE